MPNCYDFRNYSEDCRLEKSVGFEWKRNSLILSILTDLLEQGIISLTNEGADRTTLRQMKPLINRMLMHPEENLDMKTAAYMMGISYYHFSRLFKLTTGFNFSEYSNLLRIRKAEDLLLNTDMSVSAVSSSIGIETQSYFTRLFRTINGISPIEYRNKYKN